MKLFFKITTSVFLFNFYFSTGQATSACFTEVKSAPKCPTSGSLLLDDSYPVSSAIVSTEQGLDFAYQFVTKVGLAQSSSATILLSATTKEFKEIKNRINKDFNLSQEEKSRITKNIRNIEKSNGASGENWQQDYFEAQFNPKTGQPIMKESGKYLKNRNMRLNYANQITEKLSDCGVTKGSTMTVDFDPEYIVNGMSGGNLESLPNGICLVGRDSFDSDQHLKSYVKSACGTDEFLETPSDFLEVGHTDEFMNVIKDPTKSPPCDYSVTLASPRKAIELLKENPQAPLFSQDMLNAMNNEKDPGGRIRYVCRKIKEKILILENKKEILPVDFNKNAESTSKNEYHSLLISAAIAFGDENELERKISEMKKRIKNDPKAECKLLRNSDLLKFYESEDFDRYHEVQPSEVKLANEAIQKKLDQFKEHLIKKTSQHVPSCKPEIIDVPYLFNALFDKKTKSARLATSIFPNSTNGLRIGDKYIFSSPGNDVFGKYTEEQYLKHGMKTDRIDTYWAHSLGGNLHCSSHLLRYCNPIKGVE